MQNKNTKFPLRTPQKPQPVFDPDRVSVHFTFCCHTCTHCALISCTAVHLYFIPVSVHSGTVYTTTLYKCTLASASLASVLSTNHRRPSIYLLRSDSSMRHPHHPTTTSLITACWHSPSALQSGLCKNKQLGKELSIFLWFPRLLACLRTAIIYYKYHNEA